MPADDRSSRRIVLAFDGSPASRAAIAVAGRLFGDRAAVVVNVWQSIEPVAAAATAGMPAAAVGQAARQLDAAAEAAAQERAAEGVGVAHAAGLTAEFRAVRAEQSVWVTICRFAREIDAAAIVMGSRGQSGIRSALLGSVSNGVVHHSGRPTLVVREQDGEPAEAA